MQTMPTKSPELFPYQSQGVTWLNTKRLALLADEMGLGKSAQIVSAAEQSRLEKIIIICPSIARLTWEREINLWSRSPIPPTIQILKHENEVPDARFDIHICSFHYASYNFNLLRNLRADLLVVDEAHAIKSGEALRTQSIMGKDGVIHGVKRVWLVTGTPMPNHPGELWAMLFTFGLTKLNYDAFITKFCETYQFNGRDVVRGSNRAAFPELRAMLDRIMLRRKVKDVLKELPEVRISILPIEAELEALTPELQKQYDTLQQFLDRSTGSMPYFTDATAQLATLEAMAESVSSLRRFAVMKVIKPVCDLVLEELENKTYEKIILFAIHREAVTEATRRLHGKGAVSIHGAVSAEQRQRNIDAFQNDPNCHVIVINIGAGGTNITLTAATEVIFLEEDYVPGNNAQAVARARRIGQKYSVNVRVVTLAGTIYEKVSEILVRKMKDIFELLG